MPTVLILCIIKKFHARLTSYLISSIQKKKKTWRASEKYYIITLYINYIICRIMGWMQVFCLCSLSAILVVLVTSTVNLFAIISFYQLNCCRSVTSFCFGLSEIHNFLCFSVHCDCSSHCTRCTIFWAATLMRTFARIMLFLNQMIPDEMNWNYT